MDMLRDRFPVDFFFIYILKLTGITIDPELVELDRILEDDEIFQRIKHDLSQRHPKTLVTGRKSTPVEAVIRQMALKAGQSGPPKLGSSGGPEPTGLTHLPSGSLDLVSRIMRLRKVRRRGIEADGPA
jgi:hypothetical protein